MFKSNTPQAESPHTKVTGIRDSLQMVPLQGKELSLQKFPFLSIWVR